MEDEDVFETINDRLFFTPMNNLDQEDLNKATVGFAHVKINSVYNVMYQALINSGNLFGYCISSELCE